MLRGLVKLVTMQMLQRWMSSRAMAPSSAPDYPGIRPNLEQIKSLAVRYVTLSVLAFLNFLLFVGGVIVTAVAMAHSFDLYGEFRFTSVLWTGIIITLTALVVGGLCGYALISTKISAEDLVVHDPAVEEAPRNVADRIFRPIFEGILAGLASPRYRPTEERGDPAA